MSQAEITAVTSVLRTERLGMGVEVENFEKEIQRFLNTERYILCVNTGTAALHLSMQAIGVGPGDEVIIPSLTYVASFQAVSATGC